MITMTTTIDPIHGARSWSGRRVMPLAPVVKQYPSVRTLGAFGADKSTGVSAQERRHR